MKRVVQAGPPRHFLRPCFVTVGPAAPDALSQRLQFLFAERLVPLDVSADNRKVIVVGNGKTNEAGLVQVLFSGRVAD